MDIKPHLLISHVLYKHPVQTPCTNTLYKRPVKTTYTNVLYNTLYKRLV